MKEFFTSALVDLRCAPHEAVMIGDVSYAFQVSLNRFLYFRSPFQDILDDIEGALLAGLNAILVRTGKYRLDDEKKSNFSPTAICENFYEAVQYLLKEP